MRFPMRNVGSDVTEDLYATLLPSANILMPSGPRQYGALSPAGPPVARDFVFTANGACGTTINANFNLTDPGIGAPSLGQVSFPITLGIPVGGSSVRSNAAAMTIPGTGTGASTGAPASPYPSSINAAGISGTVTKVTVTLNNFSHTFPSDVDVLLVGPGGQTALLLSDVGGGTDAVNTTLTFDDSAAPIGATIVSGTFQPTNIGTGDLFPAPAPAGPYNNSLLSVFNGLNPNGTWSLYVVDDAGIDTGSMSGGWSITFTTLDYVCP
jgi:subtilisin-like proprotein convertase family protein